VRDEALYASVVTLVLLLDSAREDRLWQLLLEADAPRVLSELHRQFPELPPVPLAKLLGAQRDSVWRFALMTINKSEPMGQASRLVSTFGRKN
jgi:hypothetical protein